LAWDQAFISLRDQAVRVRMLLRSMKDENLFMPMPGLVQNVLVVGAGYAGVNAAMWLVSAGIPATLVERGVPFGMQAGCDSRYLSLTQYDWPAAHHGIHTYPAGMSPDFVGYKWLSAGMPDHLTTTGLKLASDHVPGWTAELNACVALNPGLL